MGDKARLGSSFSFCRLVCERKNVKFEIILVLSNLDAFFSERGIILRNERKERNKYVLLSNLIDFSRG